MIIILLAGKGGFHGTVGTGGEKGRRPLTATAFPSAPQKGKSFIRRNPS